MKVAAAQIQVTTSKDLNVQTILRAIKKAKKADVICFPELSIQCDENNVLPISKELAILSKAAVQYDVNLIFGAYVRADTKIKNTIFVMNRNGEIVHRYNKKHPYSSEEEYLSKGRKNAPFILDGVPCAVINCWDYAFPEFGRELAKEGAKVFFCPSYLLSFPKTKNVLTKIPQIRAFDFMSYFIMVDAVAEETFKRSKICHPLRQMESIKDKEGIIYADLNVEEIDILRHEFKNFRTRLVH